jgi:hypothetical protein
MEMEPRLTAYLLTPTGVLGKVAVVTVAEQLPHGLRGESFLLVENSSRRLYATRISFEGASVDHALAADFDLDFMIDEALTAAQSDLANLRVQEFERNGDEGVFSAWVHPTELKRSPATWCTALSAWPEEIKKIADSTQHQALGDLLGVVISIRRLIVRDQLTI